MKMLRVIGIVVGVHALALVIVLANPGCSSSKAKPALVAPVADQGVSAPAPVPGQPAISLPGEALAPAAPVAGDAGSQPGILYTPTRPGTPAAAALVQQPVTGVTPATTYEVQRGDSLWSIAKRHHVRAADLAKANHLRTSSALHAGQKLIIPATQGSGSAASGASESAEPAYAPKPAKSHAPAEEAGGAPAPAAGGSATWTVRPGETLGAIARRFGVRVGVVAQANNITDPQKIRAGDVLVIPNPKRMPSGAGHAAAAAAQPSAAEAAAQPAETTAPASPSAAPAPAADQSAASSNDTPVIKVDDNPPPAAPVN